MTMEVRKRIDVIKKNYAGVGNGGEKRKEAWEAITHAVNAVSSCKREVSHIKKKWCDLRTSVKKKEAQKRRAAAKTGKL